MRSALTSTEAAVAVFLRIYTADAKFKQKSRKVVDELLNQLNLYSKLN